MLVIWGRGTAAYIKEMKMAEAEKPLQELELERERVAAQIRKEAEELPLRAKFNRMVSGLRAGISTLCLTGAAVMLFYGTKGWGWLLLAGILCVPVYMGKK